jgi:hypothetical protein
LPERNKGDNLDQQDQYKRVSTLAYNSCPIKFKAQRRIATILPGNNAKVPRRTYECIVVEVEDTYDVNKGTIKKYTVRIRMFERNIIVVSKGPTSPMARL